MRIPILNLYYLLSYAWDKLEESAVVDVSGIESARLVDLLAKVLSGGVSHVLRRGLDRGYLPYKEDTSCPHGKMEISETIKRGLHLRRQLHCAYDDLSYDVPHNQIVKSSLRRLHSVHGLNQELAEELSGLYRRLHEVSDIPLDRSAFRRVQLHRNNAFYDFLLKVCELVMDNLLVDERTGASRFRDFTRDEEAMAGLFEVFVRNFYAREVGARFKVKSESIEWDVIADDSGDLSLLPSMRTDTSLSNPEKKIVVETKYYQETLQTYRGKTSVRSAHLYQLFAYLKNLETRGGTNADATGILLYPVVDRRLSERFRIQGHTIWVRTVDLNQPWQKIHDDLITFVAEA